MKTMGELKQLLRCVKSFLIWGVNWISFCLALGERFPGNSMVSIQMSPDCDYNGYVVLINRLTIQAMARGFKEMSVICTKYN